MVKKVRIESHYPQADSLIGKFLDDSSYDVVFNEDVDVYGPLKPMQTEDSEENLLLSFRKGVFPMEMVYETWEHIRTASLSVTDNRGISAGVAKIDGNPRYRLAYTDEQARVMRLLMDSDKGTLYDDEIVYDASKREVSSTRFYKWVDYKMSTENFVFDDWFKKVVKFPPLERAAEATRVFEAFVSNTSYANQVFSGLAGFYDRYLRIPYCRETMFNANHFEKYKATVPFIEAVSEQFRLTTPNRYAKQIEAIEKLDPRYRVGKSAYTTITVNKNYRTACHTDAGDLPQGFGNLTVVTGRNCKPWKGAILVFPHYRAAVNVQPGDMLAMNVHEYHGNTDISGEMDADGNELFERISLVCYFREGMQECKSFEYENLRRAFVKANMANKSHPLWAPKWNGTYTGMWESADWIAMLKENGLSQYAPVIQVEEVSSLDDFM